ncbi:baseplate J/gp47 family protein [Shinella sp. HZN7]|uniref:baseplate J/gp47 family protein n=1 Tax=Shinella sp. (strain HZN7) TaxID=879274 RepID=UPI0007DA8AC6|nr:baseplate J/gp47 family protein [Shinella sp. HZN7]ANH04596.1 Baseplate J family protein [Shinella sp. HZN7]
MPWIAPKGRQLAERFASSLEDGLLTIRSTLDPIALSRAVRSPRGVFAQIGRAVVLVVSEIHEHVGYWSRQIFVDTAEDENVLRHAGIWGVDQRQPVAAIGTVLIEGDPGFAVPIATELSASNGVLYETTVAAILDEDGLATVAAAAIAPGPAGNLEAGIRLATVVAVPEIDRITVESAFVGGVGEWTMDELAAAVLAHIRQRPHGGAAFDYPVWLAQRFSVAAVNVVEDWIGRGSVGIVAIMRDPDGTPRVPSSGEIEAMQAFLGDQGSGTGVRPVTARIVVVAGEIVTLPLTVRIRPDTPRTRAAVTEAWQRFVSTLGDADDDENAGPIGARIEPSRISEAISAASGEYAHDLIVPAAPYTLDRTEFPVAGIPTFEA